MAAIIDTKNHSSSKDIPFLNTNYILGAAIGEGASAKVVLATTNDPNRQKAIKIFPKWSLDHYHREKKALELLRGAESVVQMEAALEDRDCSYIVMDKYANDFATIVANGAVLDEVTARSYFREMVNGLISVHGAGICHHDVKLDNFLLGSQGEVVLTDFGCSIVMDSSDWAITSSHNHKQYIKGSFGMGTTIYSPPQVLFGQPHQPEPTDIYSLGICLYRMLVGRFPFCQPDGDDTLDELKKRVVKSADQSTIDFPSFLSPKVRRLLCGMLAFHESERWDWITIVECDWCSEEKIF